MAKTYNAKKEEIESELGGREMMKYDLEVRKTFDKLTEYNEVKQKYLIFFDIKIKVIQFYRNNF